MRISRRTRGLLLTGLLVALATLPANTAAAQTTDPSVITFRASANHESLGSDGRPMVSHYVLELFRLGRPEPAVSRDLGKPSVGPDGYVRVTFDDHFTTAQLADSTLEARVAAVGPGGTARSAASNLFSVSACQYAFPGGVSVPSNGGALSVTLETSPHCPWEARSDTPWLSTTLESSGRGAGQMTMTADVNTTALPRLGIVSIGSHVMLVVQAAATTAAAAPPR